MKLGKLFSDGAVIQRRQTVPVWGWTEPNCAVKATLAGNCAYAVSSVSGEFLLRLPPMDLAGGPYVLTVENTNSGDRIEVKNILFGEVWLASGQSNMEFCMGTSPLQLEEFRRINPDPSTLRMITVEKSATSAQQNDFSGEWLESTDQNVPGFSAVALWFGYRLRERLGVPVGLIASSWGGTIIEAWTSRNTLACDPELAPFLREYEQRLVQDPIWQDPTLGASSSRFGSSVKGDPGNKGVTLGWAEYNFDDSDWIDFGVPGSWTGEGLAGNGAVWIRREFDLPAEWAGKKLVMELGGIDKHDVTYFNGVEIGASGKGFDEAFWCAPRRYTVPGNLVREGKNRIAIRAFSFLFDGSFNGKPELYRLYPEGDPAAAISLAGTWKFRVEVDFGKVRPPDIRTKGGPYVPNTWSILFDGMIRPLIPYAIRGAIWYQGESNAHSIVDSARYQRQMADLIRDWRFFWGQGNFPFHLVQLANFRTEMEYEESSTWAVLRESQRLACQRVPNTDMAVIIDCGEAEDIHPKDKRSVGFRLAAASLHNDYGCEEIVPSGPLPREISMENGPIRIRFDYADGLCFHGEPRGFYLAGNDESFLPADSVIIDGPSVVVRSARVKFPMRVRYSWADNPNGNLFNGAGLPASPFEG